MLSGDEAQVKSLSDLMGKAAWMSHLCCVGRLAANEEVIRSECCPYLLENPGRLVAVRRTVGVDARSRRRLPRKSIEPAPASSTMPLA